MTNPANASPVATRLLMALAAAIAAPARAEVTSSWVFRGDDGLLQYRLQPNGDRIPDFSAVGFGAGWRDLPATPPVIVTVPAAPGDATARIQEAIDAVAVQPIGPDGFRGTVQLGPGDHQIAGQVRISSSGIVLRGSGRDLGIPSATRLIATGSDDRDLIAIGGPGSGPGGIGSTIAISDARVPVGATSFRVASTAGLAVGQGLTVTWKSNQAWIDANGMNLLDNPWQPGARRQDSDRTITRIEGDRVFLDAPLTTAIEQIYGGGTIRPYTDSNRITHVGVENLIGQSLAARDEANEARARSFIGVGAAEHVYVREIEARHFVYAAVDAGEAAKFVTVADARSVEPAGLVTGSRRYTYNVDGQLVLVRDSQASEGRHDFVTGSNTAGPSVFTGSTASDARAEAGPHQRWASGILFDTLEVSGAAIAIRDRGNSGSGHGWAGANSVVWNSRASELIVQNPPTAQNWLIGSEGRLVTEAGRSGTYDSPGTPVSLGDPVNNPTDSLYAAQLLERRATGTDLRFWIGDQGPAWRDAAAGWTNWSRTLAGRTNAAAPGPRDDVVFPAAIAAPLTVRPGVDTAVHGLVFDTAAVTLAAWRGSRAAHAGEPWHRDIRRQPHDRRRRGGGSATPGDLLVTGSQTWEIRGSSELTIAGRLGNAGATGQTITKAGPGRLVLAAHNGGSNSFKAAWQIDQGVVRVGDRLALGWSSNPVSVASGAALELDGVDLAVTNADVTLRGFGAGGSTGSLRSLRGDVAIEAAAGRLILDSPLTGIGVDSGSLLIARSITGSGGLFKTGPGRLRLAGSNDYANGTLVTAGVLEIQSASALPGSLTLAGGRVDLPADRREVLAVSSLVVNQSAGLLDLAGGAVAIAAGGITPAELRADILAGRGGGGWDGSAGITSSLAAAAGGSRVVGYTIAADGGAVVSCAVPGDVDLNGRVDVFDLVGIDGAGRYGSGGSSIWDEGDFTYDGVTNVFDLVLTSTAGGYGAGSYFQPAAEAAVVATVPEPTAAAVIVITAIWLIHRKQRRGDASPQAGF